MAVTYEAYSDDDRERLASEGERSSEDRRGPFERDRARIIHSAAFRKLQGKTQVYGLGASDYYRTRLTHSLEVAQIGKALALRLDADPTLVEAVCLAHDIGHPPFGHAGEYALHDAMRDVEGFNGNAQNIRILTYTEEKSDAYDGLNLTKATLDGLIKYPQPIDPLGGVKKGYYRSDESIVLSFRIGRFAKVRTFECEIMNWSDDIAYSSHDLEDALVIGTVQREDLEKQSKQEMILAIASKSYGDDYPEFEKKRKLTAADVDTELDNVIRQCMTPQNKRLARIKMFVASHINDCVITANSKPTGEQPRRYAFSLQLDPAVVRKVEIYKAITHACVINTNPVLTLQQAGRKIVKDLYKVYSDDQNDVVRFLYPDDWGDRVGDALTEVKTGVDRLALKRLSRDYIATMTDRFAEEQWRRLNLPGGNLFVARA